MDIMLINPGNPRVDHATEHIGVACLKSYVQSKEFVADVLDMALEELTVDEATNIVHSEQPKMVGISLLEATKIKGLDLVKKLRIDDYQGKIVVGGYFATFASQDILKNFEQVDYIVRGEGEITLVELMEYIIRVKGKLENILGVSYRKGSDIIENQARPLIADLDILPPPDRKYANFVLQKNAFLRVYSTRGCWGQCTFCDIIGLYGTSKGKPWRRRSAKNSVDELENLINRYNTDYFIFNDDQFLVKGKKSLEFVKEFAAELERRNLKIKFELMCRADTVNKKIITRLKSIGLQRVFLGLESFDPKQLERYRKKISIRQNLKAVITLYQLKINVIASVILADAYTTLWDLLKQFVFLFELRRKYFNSRECQISINKKLEIYRGSAVYNEYRQKGLLVKDDFLEGYDFKLKFLTKYRLKIYSIEEYLGQIVFRPSIYYKSLIKKIQFNLAYVKNTFL